MNPDQAESERVGLEALIAADAQALAAESDQMGRLFAVVNRLRPNDFRALLHISAAETAKVPLTSGALRHKMGLSPAAITYLVERMIKSGHIRRDSDPHDRRKVVLRYGERGREIATAFFAPLTAHAHAAMTGLGDSELTAAHRVMGALIDGMHRFHDDVGIFGADVGTTSR
jgi:MarR family transcriptional regulator, organic hydroperoxide resistance regulator